MLEVWEWLFLWELRNISSCQFFFSFWISHLKNIKWETIVKNSLILSVKDGNVFFSILWTLIFQFLIPSFVFWRLIMQDMAKCIISSYLSFQGKHFEFYPHPGMLSDFLWFWIFSFLFISSQIQFQNTNLLLNFFFF